jgi:hypothetical protein
LQVELLEARTVFNATVTSAVNNNVLSIVLNDVPGDTSTVLIHRKSSDSTQADYNSLEVKLNGTAQTLTIPPLTTLTSIQLQAGAGTDTLKVDQGNGNLNVPVTFLAGKGSDTYVDTAADLSGVQSSGDFVLGDQLNTQLNNLQTLLDNNVYNQPLPVVATTGRNNLKDVGQADIMGTFSTTLQNDLDNTSMSNPNGLASSAGPADIQKALFAALGPSGANLLQSRPGDTNTTPDLNDIVVVAKDGTFSYEMSLAQQTSTYDTGTLLDFNPGMAGLPLTFSNQSQQVVETQLGFSYDFQFDIASKSAAVIDNSTTSSNPLLINLNAKLTSGYEDSGATLGLLNADITDGPTLSVVSWGAGSTVPTSGKNLVIVGIDNSNLLHIRIFDANGAEVVDKDETQFPTTQAAAIATLKAQLPGLLPPHVLTAAEKAQVIGEVDLITGQDLSTKLNAQYQVTFSGSGSSTTASASVNGAANINLHMVLSVMPNSLGPDSLMGGSNKTGDSINLKFFADMAGTWNFGTSAAPVPLAPLTAFGSQPAMSFGVSMDANTFFQDFVRPIIADDILPEFKSVQPISDVLDYKVPLLNFALDDVLDNAALSPVGNFRGFFQSIHKFQLLAQDLANFPVVIGQVDLGSFSISQDARVKTYGTNGNDYVSILNSNVTPPATDPLTQLRNLVSDPSHLIRDLSSQDHSLDVVGGTLQLSNDNVNFFDMTNMSIQFSVNFLFKDITFNLLQFPMLSSPVNIFNMLMNHHASLLTWDTVPVALNVQNTFVLPTNEEEIPGGAIELTPQISFLAHFAGGFDSHGLEVSDPNQGYYLTDADPAESDRTDISTIVDQFTANPNAFHSTFLSLTVAFSVDAGFSTDAIKAKEGEPSISDLGTSFSLGIGITFAGHIVWKPDDPDTSTLSQGLETSFADRTLEQQVMRPDEILNEIQNCGGTIWQETGDLTFGFNIVVSLKIFYVPIISKTINLISFKIADFNTPPCTGMATPPLAHMGNVNNNVSGPYGDANPSKEVADTLYLNTATKDPTDGTDTSQDDTFVIKALANNADGTDNLLVISQGRSEEFDNVHAIYADGGGGNDSFIIKPGVTVPIVIHDGKGNDHLEYDGSGSASLYAGDGTNALIGGTGNNILVSGDGNSTLQDFGPGTDSITVGNGGNTILGGSGTQTILVGDGNNNIEFGSGDSTITLGNGANTITGRIKEGHVKIIDASSTDTDHTGAGLLDQLILNGSTNPDNVHFSTGTLNNSPAVQIDDGTASSSWSVTAQNMNTISFNGGGNGGAVGRDGEHITLGDLSSTGVATININPNHGQTLNQQQDALTVSGTTHADNLLIESSVSPTGANTMTVHGLAYVVNFTGLEPTYDSLIVNGNGGNDTFDVTGTNVPTTVNGGTGNDVFNVSSDAPNDMGNLDGILSPLTINGGTGLANRLIVSDYGQTANANSNVVLTGTVFTNGGERPFTINGVAYQRITGFAGPTKDVDINYAVAGGGAFADPTIDPLTKKPKLDGILLRGSNTLADNFTVQNTLGGDSTTEIDGNGGNDTVTVNVDVTKNYNLIFDGGAPTSSAGDKLIVNDVTKVGSDGRPIAVGDSASPDPTRNGGAVIHNEVADTSTTDVNFHRVNPSQVDVAYLDKTNKNLDPADAVATLSLAAATARTHKDILYGGVEVVQTTPDANHSFIQALFHQDLRRDATNAEINTWLSVLRGPGGQAAVVRGVANLPEALTLVVKDWYTRYLGRSAKGAEEQQFVAYLKAGWTEEAVLSRFFNLPEYYQKAGNTTTGFVNLVYRQILNRAATAMELFAALHLVLPKSGRSGVAWSLLNSREYRTTVVVGYFRNALSRKAPQNPADQKQWNLELHTWVSSPLGLKSIRLQLESTKEYFDFAD